MKLFLSYFNIHQKIQNHKELFLRNSILFLNLAKVQDFTNVFKLLND